MGDTMSLASGFRDSASSSQNPQLGTQQCIPSPDSSQNCSEIHSKHASSSISMTNLKSLHPHYVRTFYNFWTRHISNKERIMFQSLLNMPRKVMCVPFMYISMTPRDIFGRLPHHLFRTFHGSEGVPCFLDLGCQESPDTRPLGRLQRRRNIFP